MSPEQLNLTAGKEGIAVNTNGGQTSVDVTDDGNRPPRLPRWTRHEILVLIQGKKVAENRVRRGRTGAGSAFGSLNPLEPKWASVSTYCKRHGVNRGPVQCRKRWSNLAGDFKKIKEWETQIGEESESFWVMRNDLRRERKLPGFFDREVFDILDGGVVTPLTVAEEGKDGGGGGGGGGAVTVAMDVEEVEEVVFDSGRTAAAAAEEDGLFSDEKETVVKEEVVPPSVPVSEKRKQASNQGYSSDKGTDNENQQAANPEKASTSTPTPKPTPKPAPAPAPAPATATPAPTQEGCKRRRISSDGGEEINLQEQLIKVLERNSRMLTAQIEAQNVNSQLDRDQRNDHANSLVAVLGKLADAIGKIADKL